MAVKTKTKKDEAKQRLFQSTLPWFDSEGVSIEEELTALHCPRSDCDGVFYVDRAFEKPTAPCPFCFKAARVQDFDMPDDGPIDLGPGQLFA